ncbi:MAG: DUF4386 domain-containing protein [Candidatus Marinimicrobia bacterium]|nr:DUF4386 domain-containing protein [Candidatus Neomarinimicrobiota bacterium]MBL7047011.1 DUF4386 domain-containing protein [Candidatus Neomarinimicrobiota bacterium]
MKLIDLENPKKTARIAGLLYLGLIVFGIAGMVVRVSFIEPGDAATTANNIIANKILFSAANVSWLISEMFLLLLGLALYVLLKPVNKIIASLIVLFITVGVSIECLNTLNLFAALKLLSGADYLTVFGADQLNAQVMYHLDLWESGYRIAVILSFGPWLIPTGYLMYTSGYFPKLLGILGMLAGIGFLIESFQYFLLPDNEVISSVGNVAAIIGEFAICGWLLIKGVNVEQWEKRALASA